MIGLGEERVNVLVRLKVRHRQLAAAFGIRSLAGLFQLLHPVVNLKAVHDQ
jgi:uncharacterized membrane protein